MIINKIISKLSTKFIFYVLLALLAIYLTCMIIIPVHKSGWNWKELNQLLYDWQTFNASMIALIASLIALSTTTYKEEKQRERNLRAAKAFLPHSLSALCNYCEVNIRSLHSELVARRNDPSLLNTGNINFAQFNEDVLAAFSDCIRHAEASDGDFLSELVNRFQVTRSRFNRFTSHGNRDLQSISTIYDEIIFISTTRKLIDNSFEYARNTGDINKKKIDHKEIRNILFFNCGIHQIDENLINHINRRFNNAQ